MTRTVMRGRTLHQRVIPTDFAVLHETLRIARHFLLLFLFQFCFFFNIKDKDEERTETEKKTGLKECSAVALVLKQKGMVIE